MAAEPLPPLGSVLFVDTNIWVHASVSGSPWHSVARSTIDLLRQNGVILAVSRQVLREYAATLTRPQSYSQPIPSSIIATHVEQLSLALQVLEEGPAVTSMLISLLRNVPCGGKQIHDANIVATMLTHGVDQLLTHNTADFVRFAGYVAVRPLVP